MNRGGGPGRRIPGAAGDGVIEGGYLDAVKLTAHSCPTFAGAYRMTLTAMARLYPDAISAYGHLPMRVRQRLDEGAPAAGRGCRPRGRLDHRRRKQRLDSRAWLARRSRGDLRQFGVLMRGGLRSHPNRWLVLTSLNVAVTLWCWFFRAFRPFWVLRRCRYLSWTADSFADLVLGAGRSGKQWLYKRLVKA